MDRSGIVLYCMAFIFKDRWNESLLQQSCFCTEKKGKGPFIVLGVNGPQGLFVFSGIQPNSK